MIEHPVHKHENEVREIIKEKSSFLSKVAIFPENIWHLPLTFTRVSNMFQGVVHTAFVMTCTKHGLDCDNIEYKDYDKYHPMMKGFELNILASSLFW
jgi:hypothetical protein